MHSRARREPTAGAHDGADDRAGRTGSLGDVELVTVGGVDHLFIAGHGPPTPLEYKVDNHVDARVIAKLVSFVTR